MLARSLLNLVKKELPCVSCHGKVNVQRSLSPYINETALEAAPHPNSSTNHFSVATQEFSKHWHLRNKYDDLLIIFDKVGFFNIQKSNIIWSMLTDTLS